MTEKKVEELTVLVNKLSEKIDGSIFRLAPRHRPLCQSHSQILDLDLFKIVEFPTMI